jgi:hypothetical protein
MAPNSCVTSGVFAHFLISGFDFAGPYRSAEVTFIFTDQQDELSGQHPAVFSASHPNCHAGFQATVFRKEITGNPTNNVLRIVQSDDEFNGFDECGDAGSAVSADVNVGTLVTGIVPRYKLTLLTYVDGTNVEAMATLVDTTTSTTLGTVSKTFEDKPDWYDNQAQRLGFGGGFGSVCVGGSDDGDACQGLMGECPGGTCSEDPSIFYTFDDFDGTTGFGDGTVYVSFHEQRNGTGRRHRCG